MHTTNPPGGRRLTAMDRPKRIARSMMVAALLLALLLTTVVTTHAATVAPREDHLVTGGLHAGPIGLNPPVKRIRSTVPTAIQIDKAQVDAEVETIEIVDGVMQDPTGPWVVSWYQETAKPGEDGNTVMAGHVDYWDVGPAVFYNLKDLSQDDEIQVIGEDGSVYTYAVDWMETYTVAQLTPADLNEIVGPTEDPSLTLITCGGEFDAATGEYLSRTVIRAIRVEVETRGAAVPAEEDSADRDNASAPVVEGDTAVIAETSVNLRAAPSTSSEVVTVLEGGTEVTVTGPAEEGDGLIWLPVEDAKGNTGYVARELLAGRD